MNRKTFENPRNQVDQTAIIEMTTGEGKIADKYRFSIFRGFGGIWPSQRGHTRSWSLPKLSGVQTGSADRIPTLTWPLEGVGRPQKRSFLLEIISAQKVPKSAQKVPKIGILWNLSHFTARGLVVGTTQVVWGVNGFCWPDFDPPLAPRGGLVGPQTPLLENRHLSAIFPSPVLTAPSIIKVWAIKDLMINPRPLVDSAHLLISHLLILDTL